MRATISAVNTVEPYLFDMVTGKNNKDFFWRGGGVIFFLISWGGGVFFIFWGVCGIQFFFLIGGSGVCAFFKLTGSGGHRNCFLGDGGGSVKKCLPPSPSD